MCWPIEFGEIESFLKTTYGENTDCLEFISRHQFIYKEERKEIYFPIKDFGGYCDTLETDMINQLYNWFVQKEWDSIEMKMFVEFLNCKLNSLAFFDDDTCDKKYNWV